MREDVPDVDPRYQRPSDRRPETCEQEDPRASRKHLQYCWSKLRPTTKYRHCANNQRNPRNQTHEEKAGARQTTRESGE